MNTARNTIAALAINLSLAISLTAGLAFSPDASAGPCGGPCRVVTRTTLPSGAKGKEVIVYDKSGHVKKVKEVVKQPKNKGVVDDGSGHCGPNATALC
jgi:hypothetical protein